MFPSIDSNLIWIFVTIFLIFSVIPATILLFAEAPNQFLLMSGFKQLHYKLCLAITSVSFACIVTHSLISITSTCIFVFRKRFWSNF